MKDLRKLPAWITVFKEQIEYLESIGGRELQCWLSEALSGKPQPVWLGSSEAYHYVVNLYSSASYTLQQRIKDAISSLIYSWNEQFHEMEYLYHLIYLAGRLRVTDTYAQILLWVHQGRFKGLFVPDYQRRTGKDLHLYCLMAVGPQALPGDEMLRQACVRDIERDQNPYYFGVCYRILFSNYTNSSEYLLKYFPSFLRYCMGGYYSFFETFYFIYKNDTCQKVLAEKPELILAKLTDEEEVYLLRAIANAITKKDMNTQELMRLYDHMLCDPARMGSDVFRREYDFFLAGLGKYIYDSIMAAGRNEIINKAAIEEYERMIRLNILLCSNNAVRKTG